MLFQLKAVSERSCLISFLIFALQIYRSAQSVNKVSGRLGDQCQNQEFWVWAVNLGAEGYSTQMKWEWKAFSYPLVTVSFWPGPGVFSGFAHGEQRAVGLLRYPCLLQEWRIRVLRSSLYIWHGTWTRSTSTWPSLSFEHFSVSFFHDFFSKSPFPFSPLPIWTTHLLAVITIPNSKVLSTEESEMVPLFVADQSRHEE